MSKQQSEPKGSSGGKPMAIAIREASNLFPGWTMDQVELIGKTIAPDLDVEELALLLAVAHRAGLDVFSRQVYSFINPKTQQLCIGIGIDGLRAKADETGDYAPGPEPTFDTDAEGNVVAATAYVKKWSHGEWHTVKHTCRMAEWKRGTPNWEKAPQHQLAVRAESHALRRAFPNKIAQLDRDVEITDGILEGDHPVSPGQVIETTATVVEPPPPAPAPYPEPAAAAQLAGKPVDIATHGAVPYVVEAYKAVGLNKEQARNVIDLAAGVGAVPESPDEYNAGHVVVLAGMFTRAAEDLAAGAKEVEEEAEEEPRAPVEPTAGPDLGPPSQAYEEAVSTAEQWGATAEQMQIARQKALLASTPPGAWVTGDRETFLGRLQDILGPPSEPAP